MNGLLLTVSLKNTNDRLFILNINVLKLPIKHKVSEINLHGSVFL